VRISFKSRTYYMTRHEAVGICLILAVWSIILMVGGAMASIKLRDFTYILVGYPLGSFCFALSVWLEHRTRGRSY
jgi:hypothetical protein